MKPISSEEHALQGPSGIGGAFLLPRTSLLAANAAVAGMFLTAYVALEWVSFIHEYKGLPVTPWNPSLGVVFALMVFVESWGTQGTKRALEG